MAHYFVTGANRGVGLAFVQQILSRPDAKVVAAARTPTAELSELKSAHPDRLTIVELDVTNEAQIAHVAEVVKSTLGYLNVIINNAGILDVSEHSKKSIADVTAADVAKHLAVNAIGPVLVVQALLPLLQAAPEGQLRRIGNVSSRFGSVGDNTSGGYYAYRSSKAALNQLSKCMAVEFAPFDINVVTLHPGHVRTRMGGPTGAISAEESATGLLNVIETSTKDQSGQFFNWKGDLLPF